MVAMSQNQVIAHRVQHKTYSEMELVKTQSDDTEEGMFDALWGFYSGLVFV